MEYLLPIADQISQILKKCSETISIAESSTGGLISAVLLSVQGASAYYVSGAVIYTHKARLTLTNIGDDDMREMHSASEPYAKLLARATRERAGTSWGLAETGASGPTGNRYGDLPGHTCFAVSSTHSKLFDTAETLETGSTNRIFNMRIFAKASLELMLKTLQQFDKNN